MVDFGRRVFLAGSCLNFITPALAAESSLKADADFIARLKGFNFSYFYKLGQESGFDLDDFYFISESGFSAARIPFDYRVFFRSLSPVVPDEKRFSQLDKLIDCAIQLRVHVSLCMHRAPGYCVNPPYENRSLWRDHEPLDEFLAAWSYIAERYASVGCRNLSFNLLNEPKREVSEIDYLKVIYQGIDVIRAISPGRVIVLDGLVWGTEEINSSLLPDGVVQGARGYYPMHFTHHQASWVNEKYRNLNPTWPINLGAEVVGYDSLLYMFRKSWPSTIGNRKPVTVGEFGVFNKTPHDHTLNYMSDCLRIFDGFGWGWLLWNFRGPFGVVNSERQDVSYTKIGQYAVDMKMLHLLKSFL